MVLVLSTITCGRSCSPVSSPGFAMTRSNDMAIEIDWTKAFVQTDDVAKARGAGAGLRPANQWRNRVTKTVFGTKKNDDG